jgi:hypothetical protein
MAATSSGRRSIMAVSLALVRGESTIGRLFHFGTLVVVVVVIANFDVFEDS